MGMGIILVLKNEQLSPILTSDKDVPETVVADKFTGCANHHRNECGASIATSR
jgi:hypothetical protein